MTAFTKSEAAALPVRLSSPYARTIEVNPYDLEQPMVCEFEFDPGEDPIVTGGPDNWHPGSPPNVVLLSCRIGGVLVDDMLSLQQTERIEEAILEALE